MTRHVVRVAALTAEDDQHRVVYDDRRNRVTDPRDRRIRSFRVRWYVSDGGTEQARTRRFPTHALDQVQDLLVELRRLRDEQVPVADDGLTPATATPTVPSSLAATDIADQNSPGTNRVLTISNNGSIYALGNSPLVAMSSQALAPAGGDQPHNNMMPYLTLSFCIALQGVFPPRT